MSKSRPLAEDDEGVQGVDQGDGKAPEGLGWGACQRVKLVGRVGVVEVGFVGVVEENRDLGGKGAAIRSRNVARTKGYLC